MSRKWGVCVTQVRYDTETGHWGIAIPENYEDNDMLAWYILTQLSDMDPPDSPVNTTYVLNLEIEWETLLSLDRLSR